MDGLKLVSLPFDLSWPEVQKALTEHRNLVLVAEPGAGKTTRFPAMLIAQKIIPTNSQVVVLEPRRLAARAAATRIAEERNLKMKTDVGYSVRFDHQITDSTPLAFLTEGLFLRRMASNPTLTGTACVVLDEFHERSRYTDLAIALLKELQFLERPDLRIVVMSATIDAESISRFLAIDDQPAPIVNVPGRTFPVEVRNSAEPLTLATDRAWTERIAKLIKTTARGPRLGDMLCFLPGVGEIRRVQEALETDSLFLSDFQILELHGSLSLDQQSRVLKPSSSDARPRIILATNIAETSLTIDGVGTVIDSGLARVARADRLGFSRLHLERISLASAKQRTGRAGRQSAGISVRAWSKQDEGSFQAFDEAELQRVDLTDSLLDLIGLGVHDPRAFDWFEKPDQHRLERSLGILQDLGAIDENGRLTKIGEDMHRTGLPARVARMVVAAQSNEIKSNSPARVETFAAIISGLLTEKDSVREGRLSGHECDLYARAELLIGPYADKNIRRAVESYMSPRAERIESAIQDWDEKMVAALLLKGFPDRVARRRRPKNPQARMVGGRGIELHPSSSVRDAEFFFALRGDAGSSRQSGDPLTTVASPIRREWIEEFSTPTRKQNLTFEDESLTAYSETALMYRDLPLEVGSRRRPDPNEVLELLKREAIAREKILKSVEACRRILARLQFLNVEQEEIDSTFSDALEQTLFGETTIKFLLNEDGNQKLAETWEQILTSKNPNLMSRLRTEAPSHFIAPTGNRFRIEYPENQSPFLEVRLQELFGINQHPKVGEIPLIFHLLGPNYRPVQVTSDLPGFWRGSYFEVRKELRARYPKHSWPENPLEAPPVARGRSKK